MDLRLENLYDRRIARQLLIPIVVLVVAGSFANRSNAAFFTLTDDNSSATFQTNAPSNTNSWVVDGVNHLFQQAFWYRVGDSAPEQSLHLLPIASENASDATGDLNDDTLNVLYSGAGFNVEVRYGLSGGTVNSGVSDMAEQIKISNLTGSFLNFHFFQFVNFDLMGTAGGDSAVFLNTHTVLQNEGTLALAETVTTPFASHREINFHPAILNKLNDALPTTLSDLPPTLVPLGIGDMSWAFQWDFSIRPNRSVVISKDKRIEFVPEPTTSALVVSGVALLLAYRRKRS